jgi:predicted branched-subunit amino acid permease
MSAPTGTEPPGAREPTDVSTRAAVIAGARAMLPLLAGVAPFGLVIGATVATSPIDPLVGWSTSWAIYGGTAQLTAVNLFAAGAPLLVLVTAVAIVNLRLVVYATELAPHWRGASRRWRLLACFLLVDPSYAVGIRNAATGPDPREHRAHYLGGALVLWVGWLIACAVGLVVGDGVTTVVPPSLVAELMLVALVAPSLRSVDRRTAVVVAAAAAVPLVLLPLGTGSVVAAVAGAAIAVRARRRGARRSDPASIAAATATATATTTALTTAVPRR